MADPAAGSARQGIMTVKTCWVTPPPWTLEKTGQEKWREEADKPKPEKRKRKATHDGTSWKTRYYDAMFKRFLNEGELVVSAHEARTITRSMNLRLEQHKKPGVARRRASRDGAHAIIDYYTEGTHKRSYRWVPQENS